MIYKYQQQIDKLLAEGLTMPTVYAPNNMEAFRYVFSTDNPNNHKPVCIQNPSRRLPNREKLSGYALSCFNSQQNAEKKYAALCKSFRQTPKTIGDSLSYGRLKDTDGMITKPDSASGHFDLYESASCDLSKTFHITKQLWKR